MRILVTGATGFIGAYCVDELIKNGDEVCATGRDSRGLEYYSRMGITSVRLDVTKEEDFNHIPDIEFDAVVHPAGLVPSNVKKEDYDSREYIVFNTIGTLNVLEFCRRRGIGTVLFVHSQSDVEGLWDSGTSIPSDAPRCISYKGDHAMYIISKNAAVDCVLHYQEQYGIRGIIFRLPPVYGYGPHATIFKDGKRLKTGFGVFMEKARSGEPLEVWGDASLGRDIVGVKDVAEAIRMALHSSKARGMYNIASGRRTTLDEEARTMVEVFSPSDRRSEIVYRRDKANSIRAFLYDISRACEDFGWQPKMDFKMILRDYRTEEEDGRFSFLLQKKSDWEVQ